VRREAIMQTDIARVSVASIATVLGACELCLTDPVELTAAVTVQHSRGGRVQFDACERCAQAVRRVAAAAGEHASFAAGAAPSPILAGAPPKRRRKTVEPAADVVALDMVYEYPDRIRDADGTEYLVRVCGTPRADGIWEGWIDFLGIGADTIRRTDIETTQSSREDLSYWARGLEGTYFEGAFRRTRKVPRRLVHR
jgi:hypothetical protein